MILITFLTLVVTGFVACAEFTSYAFVQPVLRRLPDGERITAEQGLLRTFGLVMPYLVTASLALAIAYASMGGPEPWSWAAVASLAASLIVTLVVNVPINVATGRWDPHDPPHDWKRIRNRWELFQGVRSWLLLVGFFLVCGATALY